MRLGINLLCAAGHIGPAEFNLFDLAQESGFEHVELPALSGNASDYAAAGRRLAEAGLTCGVTAITLPEADPTSAVPEVRARGQAHLRWILDCAEAAGATTVGGPFHASIGHFSGTGPTEDELARGAESHRAMAEDAEGRGMVLALETLNRFETHFMNTAAQARA